MRTFGDAVEVNVAVSLGRSRLVVVDCDTAAQLGAFLADAEADPDTVPTVRTPGQLGPDGVTLVHRDGGHFYFTVPEGIELPEQPGSMKVGGDDGYAVIWGTGNYVLTPPSVRPEGTYEATGEPVYELPGWLAEAITTYGQGYVSRATDGHARADTSADPVARWGAGVSWAAILSLPGGWRRERLTAAGARCGPRRAYTAARNPPPLMSRAARSGPTRRTRRCTSGPTTPVSRSSGTSPGAAPPPSASCRRSRCSTTTTTWEPR